MADIAPFAELVPGDHGLSTVVIRRADLTPHTSVVNTGVVPHPVTGDPTVAFVTAGNSYKLVRLRDDATITVVIRAGWQWAAVDGTAELFGPDDPHDDLDAEGLRLLLRDIFHAAGGTHDDWPVYDQTMRDERRAAVFVAPTRVYSNPT